MFIETVFLRIQRISQTKQLAIGFGLFAVFCSFWFYEPMKDIFAGNAKLEQFFTIQIPQWLSFLNSSVGTEVSIRFYSVCILIGILSGYMMSLYLAKRSFIAGTVIDRLLIGLIIFGLIGARLLYVLVNFSQYQLDLLSIFYTWQGGLAFFGAFGFCIAYIMIYCRRFGFNTFEVLDILAPGVILGQIFGRLGNFFNYESYGGSTSVFWKMYVPETAKLSSNINQDYFHPTFLYEVIPNSILFFLVLFNFDGLTNKRSGLVFASYCVGYGIIRTLTELYRTDALKFDVFGFEILVSQAIAISLVIIGVVIFVKRRGIIFNKRTMIEIPSNRGKVKTI
jgi:phosphatidylglycerol---prolipoprotein diacylglyceryl transferase